MMKRTPIGYHTSLLDIGETIVAMVRPASVMPGLRRLALRFWDCNPAAPSVTLMIGAILIIVLFGLPLAAGAQGPLGTTFTYQGRLMQSGQYVNGLSCDFQFELYNSPGGGTQLGTTQSATLPLTNGYFTADLDFGAVFDGNARYLQIAVRCPTGSGWFTAMSQRISLNAVPYALHAANSGSIDWSQIINMPAGFADGVDNDLSDLMSSYNCAVGNTLRWDGAGWICAVPQQDHNLLSNRDLDSAHTQYLLLNGNRAMTNRLNMGGYKITNLAAGTTFSDAVRYDQVIKVNDTAGGDVSGTFSNLSVNRLYGNPITSTAPSNGQILTWDNGAWTPMSNNASFSVSGDVTGNYPPGNNMRVVGIQGALVSTTAPAEDGQVLTWNAATQLWEPSRVRSLQGRIVSRDPAPNLNDVLYWDGTQWRAGAVLVSGVAGGDLSGNYPDPIVDGLQNRPVASTQPNGGQLLGWNGISNQWEPTTDNNYPAGPAGGDLTGTYPDPDILDEAVTTAKIADDAVTAAKIADNAVGMAAINHNETMGTFSASQRTIDGGGGQYVMSAAASFTPPVNGKCLVVVDAVIYTAGSASTEPRPYIKTAKYSASGGYETDDWAARYFASNVDSTKNAAVTASHMWDVSANDPTKFGCYEYNSNNNWQDDENIVCNVSYICN